MILQSHRFMGSRDKLDTLYIHLQWTNANQKWQSGDLP